jgi:LmbE family N-acetylglucosaminyl deacetylase
MKLRNPSAALFIPDGKARAEALECVTHLGIGAHQDDLEIMAYHGIRRCCDDPDEWFGGVVCTDGAGSPRAGRYADCSDDEMRRLRAREQIEAARLGRYGFIAQLGYSSDEVKKPSCPDLVEDLLAVLGATRPRFVYTHNPADLHDTHVSVSLKAIDTIRRLPEDDRPEAVYGCEVWRGLDWLKEEDKVALDTGGTDELAKSLIEIFRSQNEAGKNYVTATLGRSRANATYYQPYEVDKYDGVIFAMDLTPLVRDAERDAAEYVLEYIDKFRRDVESRIKRFL